MKFLATTILVCVVITSILAFNDSDIKSLRGGGGGKDIVDQMYNNILDKNSELSKLEKEVETNSKEWVEIQYKFTQYKNTSYNYYQSAKNQSAAIRDSALKQRFAKMIVDSQSAFEKSNAPLNEWTKKLQAKQISMEDYQVAMKIALTLPAIEKYQQENMPSVAEYQAMLKRMEETIQKLQQKVQ